MDIVLKTVDPNDCNNAVYRRIIKPFSKLNTDFEHSTTRQRCCIGIRFFFVFFSFGVRVSDLRIPCQPTGNFFFLITTEPDAIFYAGVEERTENLTIDNGCDVYSNLY